jgi:hypothetical protein
MAEVIATFFLMPWVTPFARVAEALKRSAVVSEQCGNSMYQVHAIVSAVEIFLVRGIGKSALPFDLDDALDKSATLGTQLSCDLVKVTMQYLRALEENLDGALDAADVATLGPPAAGVYYTYRAELSWLVHAPLARIEAELREASSRGHAHSGLTMGAEMAFVRCLIAGRAARERRGAGRARALARLVVEARKLSMWAKLCPDNFEPQALIARAEVARAVGAARAAARTLERAVASARRWGAPKREAIACELASEVARARGRGDEARRLAEEAVVAYRAWGAHAKAKRLVPSPGGADAAR